jgi:hypothetical protein
MNNKKLYKIAGVSYIGIFFTAIFANFYVLDGVKEDPVGMVSNNITLISLGAMAFLFAAILDVLVAWVFNDLFKKHQLTTPSTYFRLIHAVIMGIAVYALVLTRGLTDADSILNQVEIFETIWLIGLFFFGVHLMMLSRILNKIAPKWITIALFVAGLMYMIDTTAHFVMSNYDSYADTFLTLVAIPSILGEMALSVWLLLKSRVKFR